MLEVPFGQKSSFLFLVFAKVDFKRHGQKDQLTFLVSFLSVAHPR